MKIRFTKMSGAGNDFIFLGPDQAGLRPRLSALAARLCPRRISVGADGLVLVEQTAAGLTMLYFNSDGSEAAFCGNGARCLVRFCVEKGLAEGVVRFTSRSGAHLGLVGPRGVTVSLEMPAAVRRLDIAVGGREQRVYLVDAGVPHAVMVSPEVGAIDVEALGRQIRHHGALGPEGANVDFVGTAGGAPFALRTYERGVERETLACGSGCVATAAVLRSLGLAGDTVALRVASGDVITVDLGGRLTEPGAGVGAEGEPGALLTGPAAVVYEGEIDLEETGDV